MTDSFVASTAAIAPSLPQRLVLDNGIVLLIAPNPSADIVAARLFVRGGSVWETPSQSGLASLLASLLTRGTTQRSSLEIAEAVESVGAGLGTDATTDYVLLSLKTVSEDFAPLLALAGEILRSPSFPESELELERGLTLQSIRAQREQPMALAFEALRQSMYGAHPYALSGLGTEDSINCLTQADLQAYHRRHFRPDNLVISLAGRLEVAEAIAQVEAIFGDWQAPPEPRPVATLPAIATQPTWALQDQPSNQVILMLGYLAPAVHDADYAAIKLLNAYLGNGMSSRLFVELREKQGLAYEISTFYPTRLGPAPLVAYLGTAPDNAPRALTQLQQEIERLITELLTPEELMATQNKLLGQYVLGKQSNAQIAQSHGWHETMGLGLTFDEQFQTEIQTVSPEAIQQAAARCCQQPFVSVVGPEAIFATLPGTPADSGS